MPNLRLRKLPDRTPVKLTLSLSPELNQALLDYAALYGDVYGQTEPVSELIPAMLESFLEGDRTFARHRRQSPGLPA
ncbi:MAG: transposase [Sphingomonadales bacterium 32-68-7]|nr:MAG: transposase [Sphingomonadales bacterium 12-68-11]OYX10403.1 MAG: transposase [Sphingomonadales bacterium 32-68-7]